ncbi:MAG: type III pantothenate kinase [Spirochaetia bacterium]|nr:type III pantothenate kinase [Spirochaetia bacterium]
MILAVDVGNTHSVFGLWNKRSLENSVRISTNSARTSWEWYWMLNSWVEKEKSREIQAVIYSSVVPGIDAPLTEAFEKMGISNVQKISMDMKFPYKIEKQSFPTIGFDRLVNAAGGIMYYGDNLIIVDIGTAITFCLIKNRCYLGGVIAPGIQTSIESLSSKAARLFNVSYSPKKKVLAQSTRDSMESGVYFGWRGMIREIIRQLKSESDDAGKIHFRVLGTGGIASDLGYTHEVFDIVDPDLTLRGLMELYYCNYA